LESELKEDREGRLRFVQVPQPKGRDSFCATIARGLSQPEKTLPSVYFYDSEGSRLFEQITRLPEYYLTRKEQEILDLYSGDMLAAQGGEAGVAPEIVEFGSGSSKKTRTLLEAALSRWRGVHYTAIDISGDFLKASMRRLLDDYPELTATGIAADYEGAMPVLEGGRRPRLFLFMGSNIGNFEEDEAVGFLSMVRRGMAKGDRLLVGIDLVKDPAIIEAAYNDSAGVTEAFNKNLLRRINAELEGNFDPEAFQHHAPFVPEASRIEMRLVSLRDQVVKLRDLDLEIGFRQGESMRTEISTKYTLDAFAEIVGKAGLQVEQIWTDPDQWFAIAMLGPGAV
jgi:L-histidine Nalpha-methyltransferase